MSVSQNFKYLIARMAFNEPARFLATFAGAQGSQSLRELWNGLQRRAQGDAFEPTQELEVELHGRVLVLRLPPSTVPGATLAIAVTGGDAELRVFALEVGELDTGELPFIVELGPEGPGAASLAPEPGLAGFAARVTELCTEA